MSSINIDVKQIDDILKLSSNSDIWGPHYWFFIHTLSYTYPEFPNDITRRKYYDFIMNLPLFIPDHDMGNMFSKTLDKYPVTPYLDNRESFMRWVCFIHNKINNQLGKQEVKYLDSITIYLDKYKPKRKNIGFISFFYNYTEYLYCIYKGHIGIGTQILLVVIILIFFLFILRYYK